MKTNLLRLALGCMATAIFSVSGFGQLGGPSICGKGAGYSRASVPGDVFSTAGGRSKIGSLAPITALENARLNALLTSALEKRGISVPDGGLKTVCSGFKDLGQCIAAMHAARNLKLSIVDLRSKMTGTNSANLDKAIQSLSGQDGNAKNEAKKAKKQANQDLKAVGSHV